MTSTSIDASNSQPAAPVLHSKTSAGADKALAPELVERRRQVIASGLKQRLAKSSISVLDARDGLRDCFVASYLGGVSQGLANFSLQGDVDQVSSVVESIFRRRLREAGSSWEQPDPDVLQVVKEAVDVEVHIDKLPAELRAVHDQVCTLLLGKATNLLPHSGDHSVLKSPAVSDAPAPASPTPASPAQASPAQANSVPMAKELDQVEQGLRMSLAAYLRQFADAVQQGEEHEAMLQRIRRVNTLLDTLQTMSEGAA